jgi:hypothetical protein
MKHFVYKTTHINGKYYIGRHSTENENDGYVGSGKWPSSIKDKSKLVREILEYAEDEASLKTLEGKYLREHFGKPNCMNMTSDPVGFNSDNNPMKNPEISKKISGENHWGKKDHEKFKEIFRAVQSKLVIAGIHNFLGDKNPNKDGNISRRTVARGRNIFQTNNPSIWRSKEGIHHWQNGNAPNTNGALNKKLIEEGRHNFLGPDLNNKRIAEGTHNFVGSDSNLKRLAEGRHPSQQKKICPHCNKKISIGMFGRWHGDKCKSKIN